MDVGSSNSQPVGKSTEHWPKSSAMVKQDSIRGKKFSPEKTIQLEEVLKETVCPNNEMISRLSHELGLAFQQVKTWFKNKRRQMKKKKPDPIQKRRISPKWTPHFQEVLRNFRRRNSEPRLNLSQELGIASQQNMQWRGQNSHLLAENDRLRKENDELRAYIRHTMSGVRSGTCDVTGSHLNQETPSVQTWVNSMHFFLQSAELFPDMPLIPGLSE